MGPVEGSLTSGITYPSLLSSLGVIGGNRAALVFSIYERKLAPNELLMDGIAVRADMRGRGIGSKLLAAVIELAKAQGLETVRLDVIDTNPAARRLYQRHGFKETKTERFGYLRWLLGFGATTTMVRSVTPKENA